MPIDKNGSGKRMLSNTDGRRRNFTNMETYLFKEIKVNTVALLFSDKEITFLETCGDRGNVHWRGYFLF